MTDHMKSLGQYFTVSESLQSAVFDLVANKGCRLLEPSVGAGHLLRPFLAHDINYPMTCYELDTSVQMIVNRNAHQTLIHGDFTAQQIAERYKTIVGNPPYVKHTTGNLYIKFIDICWRLLDEGGEMIFIVPSDFLKCTRGADLRLEMLSNGRFTDVILPHDESLFPEASVDVMVFRYVRGTVSSVIRVNGREMVCNVHNSIVTFSEQALLGAPVETLFHVYVGLVSGRDEVYRSDLGNVLILQDKDNIESFILPEAFPTADDRVNAHLLANKAKLMERRIKKFTETNWFSWGAPRNITSIRQHEGSDCVYVRNMTRKPEIAFRGKVQYFGGMLLCLVPKQPMTNAQLDSVVASMNAKTFRENYMYAGRFKIGHKQVSSAFVTL